jgi:hypothetical protein
MADLKLYCVYMPHFLYSFSLLWVPRLISPSLAIVNSAAVNLGVQVSP